ncbi:MAG: DUF1292 domain-containing protein [Oscillospiraceae bacterium]|jgi:uncharacterized protein YrzB (UPF0473 family)|nr:DUF1292 domain-containing protein [Oscillospiraceae bacterium]
MSEELENEFGGDFITITDDNGEEFELELIDTLELGGETYTLFLPADMEEDDPDFGYIILRIVEEGGVEEFVSIDDDAETERIYEAFMEHLFDEDE